MSRLALSVLGSVVVLIGVPYQQPSAPLQAVQSKSFLAVPGAIGSPHGDGVSAESSSCGFDLGGAPVGFIPGRVALSPRPFVGVYFVELHPPSPYSYTLRLEGSFGGCEIVTVDLVIPDHLVPGSQEYDRLLGVMANYYVAPSTRYADAWFIGYTGTGADLVFGGPQTIYVGMTSLDVEAGNTVSVDIVEVQVEPAPPGSGWRCGCTLLESGWACPSECFFP